MKAGVTLSLSLALAFGAFASPHFARAVDNSNQGNNAQAQQEARQMVPATFDLRKDLDARKVHAGDHFEAVLQHDVQLKNGPKLDGGTALLGTVTADNVQPGNARLAIRFTRARMKNGQTIAIKATVVDLAQPQGATGMNMADESGLWSPHTLRIDQIGAISGVDMHSAIGSHNSALLVSKKDDVKLTAGSQFVVAIAANSGHNGMRSGA